MTVLHPPRRVRSLLETPTLAQSLLAGEPSAALCFLAKQAANTGLEALPFGGCVERVLTDVTFAGVAHAAILGACGALGQKTIFTTCPHHIILHSCELESSVVSTPGLQTSQQTFQVSFKATSQNSFCTRHTVSQ